MKILKLRKATCAVSMSFLMTQIPDVVLAESVAQARSEMISTSMVLAEMTRVEAETTIRDYLQKSEVQSELLKQGLSNDEVSARLANLSEQELRQISGQIKEARAGGDILFTILIVVLIIFLIKRL